MALQNGLGTHFIGATLLATATSLPELSTSIATIRLRAYTMAISDIIGSNSIMLMLLLPLDILYREGLLINQASTTAHFILSVSIILTAIYLIGLLMRSNRVFLRLGINSWIVLILYLISIAILYQLR
ncbi:MAG: hypothetical protein K0U47_06280 [Epsilonproteobacteria bacterium]|nr:hypothetical protein [Campylobacterota bacterium]